MIGWLNPGDTFPPATQALTDPNGLLCASLELNAAQVLSAYEHGIFPWYSEGQPVLWWSPDPRMVLFPENFRLHRSLRKTLRNTVYEVRTDTSFRTVMHACAEPRPEQDGTWISDAIVDAYCELHEAGYAHSVETWISGELVGGLYGIALGRVFFGESMFVRRTDASKVAFAHLLVQLKRWNFGLIDCQQETRHLASLGAAAIPREQFLDELQRLIHSCDKPTKPHQPGAWRFDKDLLAELLDGATQPEATNATLDSHRT